MVKSKCSIDVSEVENDLKRIAKISQRLKHLLREYFLKLERNPKTYELLAFQPNLPGITFHKIKLTHGKHDYRIIYAYHSELHHVDVLLVFPRKRGYQIDWEWVTKKYTD